MEIAARLPHWANAILRDPGSGQVILVDGGNVVTAESGDHVGFFEDGVLRIPVKAPDESIEFYRRVGGAHFHERAELPFAMSSLDTPLYHRHIEEIRPASGSGLIVDVGGGDGRNAWPWLREGRYNLVIIDAAGAALARFRRRLAEASPELLERVLLIEADVRQIPLSSACADVVIAIEALSYLNADFESGLRECGRVLSAHGTLLLSERDFEGGLLMRLIYNGIEGMLQTARERALWDGKDEDRVRTRCFTQAELSDALTAEGFDVIGTAGMPLHSLVIGWMNGRNLLKEEDLSRIDEIHRLLESIGRNGVIRRCNVMTAARAGAAH